MDRLLEQSSRERADLFRWRADVLAELRAIRADVERINERLNA